MTAARTVAEPVTAAWAERQTVTVTRTTGGEL